MPIVIDAPTFAAAEVPSIGTAMVRETEGFAGLIWCVLRASGAECGFDGGDIHLG